MSPAELQIAITYWQGITGDPGKKTLAQLKAELAERRGGAGGGGRGGGPTGGCPASSGAAGADARGVDRVRVSTC